MSKKRKRILRSFMSLLLVFTMVFTGVVPVFAVGVGGNEPVKKGEAGEDAFKKERGDYSSYDPDDGVKAFTVPAQYGFKVIQTGSTTFTPFGTRDAAGANECARNYSDGYDASKYEDYYKFDATKGDCGWTGTNFQIYNPATRSYDLLDVKVTLHDIECNSEVGSYIWLQHTSGTPNINIIGVEEVQMTIDYFYAGTQTPYIVNGNFTVSDIDDLQYFGFSAGEKTVHQYAHKNSVLNYVKKNGLNIYHEAKGELYDSGNDVSLSARTAAGGTFSASSYTYIFGNKNYIPRNGAHLISWAHFAFSAQSMADIETPAPFKTVSDTDNIKWDKTAGAETDVRQNRVESVANSWTYSATQMVPSGKTAKFYYDSFVMSDQIESCLQINSVRVYSGNDDVTSSFDISTSGNNVVATANSSISINGLV